MPYAVMSSKSCSLGTASDHGEQVNLLTRNPGAIVGPKGSQRECRAEREHKILQISVSRSLRTQCVQGPLLCEPQSDRRWPEKGHEGNVLATTT